MNYILSYNSDTYLLKVLLLNRAVLEQLDNLKVALINVDYSSKLTIRRVALSDILMAKLNRTFYYYAKKLSLKEYRNDTINSRRITGSLITNKYGLTILSIFLLRRVSRLPSSLFSTHTQHTKQQAIQRFQSHLNFSRKKRRASHTRSTKPILGSFSSQ